jgi:hypothetical protein
MQSVLKGDPEKGSVIKQAGKQLVETFFSRDRQEGKGNE